MYRCGRVHWVSPMRFPPSSKSFCSQACSYIMVSTFRQVAALVSLQFPLGEYDSKSMLHPNMLQLSFWLGLYYSLLALPPTLDAILINSTLNAVPSGNLDRPSPVCVKNTQHPTWGMTLEQFDFSTCRHAFELIASRLGDSIYTSFDFYSRLAFPTGHDGWPLAQGAGAG